MCETRYGRRRGDRENEKMNEFNQTMDQTTEAGSTGVRMAALPAVVTALLLGTFLVFAAGMAQSDTLHNAAHDGRHSFAMPCH